MVLKGNQMITLSIYYTIPYEYKLDMTCNIYLYSVPFC